MRQVLSISLPEQVTKQIKKLSSKRGFASVSSYINYLVELDQNLISETELLQSVREARKEYKKGDTVVVNSMEDFV